MKNTTIPYGNAAMTDVPTIGAAEIADRPLRLLLEDWLRRRGTAAVPPADGFAVTDLPDVVLPHLAVSSGRGPERRVRMLFTGSIAAMFAGSEPTGRFLDEVAPPDLYAPADALYDLLESRLVPVLGDFSVAVGATPVLDTRRLYLPFAGADGGLALVAMAIVYHLTEAGRTVRPRIGRTALTLTRADLRIVRV